MENNYNIIIRMDTTKGAAIMKGKQFSRAIALAIAVVLAGSPLPAIATDDLQPWASGDISSAETELAPESVSAMDMNLDEAVKLAHEEAAKAKAGVDYATDHLMLLLDGDAQTPDGRPLLESARSALENEDRLSFDIDVPMAREPLELPEPSNDEMARESKHNESEKDYSAQPSPDTSVPNEEEADAMSGFDDGLIAEGDVNPASSDLYASGSFRSTFECIAAGEWLKGNVVVSASLPAGMDIDVAIDSLTKGDAVKGVYLDPLMEVCEDVNDPYANLDNDASWHLESANIRKGWNLSKTDGVITVVVMDTGCQLTHPDLSANLDTVHAWNAMSNCVLTSESAQHGTHVAGLVAACANNGIGVAGVSYNAKVLPMKVISEGGGTSYIIGAFDKLFSQINSGAVTNVRVINMSLSTSVNSTLVHSAIQTAVNQYGILPVASAGNGGGTNATYPSDYSECISVISITRGGNKAPDSNYGSTKDISAPGNGVYSTVPPSSYTYLNGTSQAAPIVSGVAALMFAAKPSATVSQVRNALLNSATDIGASGFDIYTGYGKVNAEAALETLLFGKVFSDVNTDDWYVTGGYLTYVVTQGLMTGYTGTSLFGPDDNMTRAQLVTALFRIANPNSQATTNPSYYQVNQTGFVDLPSYQYYTAAFNWAKTCGLITGDSSTNYTTVRPNDSCTREEAAVIFHRFCGIQGANISVAGMPTPAVTDWADVDDWARDAMKWCFHKNVIGRFENANGTYSMLPLLAVTRSQITKCITIVHRDIL